MSELKDNLPYEPNAAQEMALDKLQKLRENGENKGVIALPPGSGKTYLSALDSLQMDADRILYLIHQREILKHSCSEFKKVYGDKVGVFYSGSKERKKHIFSTIQTLYKEKFLESFDEDAFDYIILDEYHHSVCMMFQKILDYFEPDFTLGLTATPERSDMSRKELLEVCDGNEIMDWSVDKAITGGILSPFTYIALSDNVDYSDIEWKGYKYRESDLEEKLIIEERNKEIVQEYKDRIDNRKTIAFCLNIKHAEKMQKKFEEAGIRSVAVHSNLSKKERERRIKEFEENDAQVIFVVDIFNEGVDFPEASCLLLLRPTFTERIFWQQIGRGLRKHPDKDKCMVLDFIGNHQKVFMVPIWFDIENKDGKKLKPEYHYTPNSKVIFEDEVIDIIEKQKKKKRGYSKEFLKEDLLRVAEEIDGKLTSNVYDEKGKAGSHSVGIAFGSWNKALEEIGLETNAPKNIPEEKLREDLRQTVDEVGGYVTQEEHRKRGKYSPAAIRRKLGDVSWVKAVESIGVDVPTRVRRDITKKEAIKDLKRVLENHKGYLTMRAYREKGKFSAQTISNLFGSWKGALDEVGGNYPEGYFNISSKEETLIEDMKEVNKETEGMLTLDDYREHGEYSSSTVENFFGSWSEAKKKAGLEVGPGSRISKEEIIKLIKEVDKKIPEDKVVSRTQWAKHTNHGSKPVLRHFDSWKNARKEAGVRVEYKRGYTDEEILEDLREAAKKVDGRLTSVDYVEHGKYGDNTVFKRFGSWKNALKEAGLPTQDVPNNQILEEIKEVAEKTDGKLLKKDYVEYGSVCGSTINRRFGSWQEAKKKAGVIGEEIKGAVEGENDG